MIKGWVKGIIKVLSWVSKLLIYIRLLFVLKLVYAKKN